MNSGSCNIQISTLRSSPYLLPWGSSVFARIIATNNIGNSLPSIAGNGAVILTYPDAPYNLVNNV